MAEMEEADLESISYEEAMERLESLVYEIEQGDIPMDKLISSVKQASRYISHCREKLSVTTTEVAELVDSLTENADGDDEN